MMPDQPHALPLEQRQQFYRVALALADIARETILKFWRDGFSVERKSDGSFVTDADRATEQALRDRIRAVLPTHGMLGEEHAAHAPEADFQWLLDPIDGTEDFVHRVPTFGSIIALHQRGEPVVGVLDHPLLDMRVAAGRGLGTHYNGTRVRLDDPPVDAQSGRLVLSARANFVRYRDAGHVFDRLTRSYPNHRIYRSCFGHTLVAIGAADAMVDYHDRLWDLAAVPLLVTEAGGASRLLHEFDVGGAPVRSIVAGRSSWVARLAGEIADC